MPIVFNNTKSDAYANSYCDVNYADAYWLNHFDSVKSAAWDALGFSQKQQVLVQATRIIDTGRYTTIVTWLDYGLYYDRNSGLVLQFALDRDPVKYIYSQHLQFPRNLDIDPITGTSFVPEDIMMAQCEQAMFLLNYDETAMANRIQGVVNDTVGIGRGQIHLNQQYVQDGSAFAPVALEFVRPYLIKTGSRYRRS
jgi:hypothetical protein